MFVNKYTKSKKTKIFNFFIKNLKLVKVSVVKNIKKNLKKMNQLKY